MSIVFHAAGRHFSRFVADEALGRGAAFTPLCGTEKKGFQEHGSLKTLDFHWGAVGDSNPGPAD